MGVVSVRAGDAVERVAEAGASEQGRRGWASGQQCWTQEGSEGSGAADEDNWRRECTELRWRERKGDDGGFGDERSRAGTAGLFGA